MEHFLSGDKTSYRGRPYRLAVRFTLFLSVQ